MEKGTACRICEASLPHGPRPAFQINGSAKILIAAQAPGCRVHLTGVPFDDPSGVRLREWMGISREAFYDCRTVAILPMGSRPHASSIDFAHRLARTLDPPRD